MVAFLIRTSVAPTLACLLLHAFASEARSSGLPDWQPKVIRSEMRPEFRVETDASGQTNLVILADDRPGIVGHWIKSFPVEGGRHYRFSAQRMTAQVNSPRRSAVAKITWKNNEGKMVKSENGLVARPEYPLDQQPKPDSWTTLAGTYRVPKNATRALVELQLRWAPGGTVRWRSISLQNVDPPEERRVRLATVHFRPRGTQGPAQNRQLFGKLIEEAGKQSADLVCLPESLTLCGTSLNYAQAAEPIPGPSTEFFGDLAKKYNLYVVAGLLERLGAVVHNTAVLLGPDGRLIGKYHKVCLPREEIEGGITPGNSYPVFPTRFGKLGMMICWDVQFPEVARNLTNRGAEVIAMPIWGGNPALAKARAIENQIFLVSSTYTEYKEDDMKSGVWDHEGNLVAVGTKWGQVVIAEVDLNARKHWSWLGDLKARIPRERPATGFEDDSDLR